MNIHETKGNKLSRQTFVRIKRLRRAEEEKNNPRSALECTCGSMEKCFHLHECIEKLNQSTGIRNAAPLCPRLQLFALFKAFLPIKPPQTGGWCVEGENSSS
jgi:hypothetical protein